MAAEARTLNGILRTTQARTRISQPPVSTSQPLLKEMIKPMASTVPATAKGVMAMTSSRSEIPERKRVMAKPMGTPITAAMMAAAVDSISVLVSGRQDWLNRSRKLSRLRLDCITGPRNSMKEITMMAKNGTSAISTTPHE